jgi:hypothetical protein
MSNWPRREVDTTSGPPQGPLATIPIKVGRTTMSPKQHVESRAARRKLGVGIQLLHYTLCPRSDPAGLEIHAGVEVHAAEGSRIRRAHRLTDGRSFPLASRRFSCQPLSTRGAKGRSATSRRVRHPRSVAAAGSNPRPKLVYPRVDLGRYTPCPLRMRSMPSSV